MKYSRDEDKKRQLYINGASKCKKIGQISSVAKNNTK